MTKDQIKKGLAERGYDFSLIAKVIQRSPSLLSKVAARKARSLPAALAIAKALDCSVQEVFPDVADYHVKRLTTEKERAVKEAELKAKFNL